MRPLKAANKKNLKLQKNKRRTTKKVWNIIENKFFLIKFWQLLFFSSLSTSLVFAYLNQAWMPINIEQVQITGLSGIKIKDAKKVTSIFFPRNLIKLNPKEIEVYLVKNLPIKSISVSRKFFPPRIHLNLLEREPIAFASKSSLKNIEKGMIDIEGYWIPLKYVNESIKNKVKIFVDEWSPNKKEEITLIIKNRFKFKSPLKKIKLNPLQEISIETEYFNSVLLGSNTDRLMEQINKLNQLQDSLPNLLINTKVKMVDLRDPSKPELKTEKEIKKQE